MFVHNADQLIQLGEEYIQRLKDAANINAVITEETKQSLFKGLDDVRSSFSNEVAPHLGENRRKADKALYRHVSKSGLFASVDITSRRRASGARIPYIEGRQKIRTISDRTRKLQTYAGGDAAFILRFLQGGTDVRTARASGPKGRGSKATYGRRGSITPRPFALEHHYTRFQEIGNRYIQQIIYNVTKIIDNGK